MGLFSGITKAVKKVVGGVTDFAGGLLGGLDPTGLISGGLSYLGGDEANKASAASSREQMEFQERMSSTAHQREVKDLIAAGLNPILSTHGAGASSPGGSSYTAQDKLSPAVNSARQSRELSLQQRVADAGISKTLSDTDLNRELIRSARADQQLKLASARAANANAALSTADLPLRSVKGDAINSARSLVNAAKDAWSADTPETPPVQLFRYLFNQPKR